MYPGADRYSLGKVKVRVAVIVPDCGSMARTVVTVVSMPASAAAKMMPDMGAVAGSWEAVGPPEEGSDGAPVVEGVEEWAQAPNARTQVAVSRADDRVLMDMWHLLRMIGGVERCRIDVS